MGRNTYEFGYRYGLKPGELAYPHMKHYIFSNNLKLVEPDPRLHVCNLDIEIIVGLKKEEGTDIYLCGGGEFAHWLLESRLIDRIIIKLNPFVQGEGKKVFSTTSGIYEIALIENQVFEGGFMINIYEVKYT